MRRGGAVDGQQVLIGTFLFAGDGVPARIRCIVWILDEVGARMRGIRLRGMTMIAVRADESGERNTHTHGTGEPIAFGRSGFGHTPSIKVSEHRRCPQGQQEIPVADAWRQDRCRLGRQAGARCRSSRESGWR